MASNMELSPHATQQFVELLGTVVVGKGMVDQRLHGVDRLQRGVQIHWVVDFENGFANVVAICCCSDTRFWQGSSGSTNGQGVNLGAVPKLRWNHRAISRAPFRASSPSR